jgi:hypothetical protein
MSIFRLFMLRSLIVFTLAAGVAHAAEAPVGQADFQIRCMACHQVDLKTVGSSLVAIADFKARSLWVPCSSNEVRKGSELSRPGVAEV